MNLFLELISSEEYISLPLSVNGNLIDNSMDQPSLHTKRLFEKEKNTYRVRFDGIRCYTNYKSRFFSILVCHR
jgi:hypothetical protein